MKRAPWSLPQVAEDVVDGIMNWNKGARETVLTSEERRSLSGKSRVAESVGTAGKGKRKRPSDDEEYELQDTGGRQKKARTVGKTAAGAARKKEEETRGKVRTVGKKAEKMVSVARQRKAQLDEQSGEGKGEEAPEPGKRLCVVM